MQYIKCHECIHSNAACRYKMAKAMEIIRNLEDFINLKEPNTPLHKCCIKLDFECTAFNPKLKEATHSV